MMYLNIVFSVCAMQKKNNNNNRVSFDSVLPDLSRKTQAHNKLKSKYIILKISHKPKYSDWIVLWSKLKQQAQRRLSMD